jgi:hypothetical protein
VIFRVNAFAGIISSAKEIWRAQSFAVARENRLGGMPLKINNGLRMANFWSEYILLDREFGESRGVP